MFSSKLNDRKGADHDPRINQNRLLFIIMAVFLSFFFLVQLSFFFSFAHKEDSIIYISRCFTKDAIHRKVTVTIFKVRL